MILLLAYLCYHAGLQLGEFGGKLHRLLWSDLSPDPVSPPAR
jgi:hypothetical protein